MDADYISNRVGYNVDHRINDLVKAMSKKITHKQLQDMAIYWLYDRGCYVFAQEVPFGGEFVDAIGIKYKEYQKLDFDIYTIEAKASRSDLVCEKQKHCYWRSIKRPHTDFYYLIVADGVDVEALLYPLWGVMNEHGKIIRRAKRLKPENKEQLHKGLMRELAHVLVYKVFGKLYL